MQIFLQLHNLSDVGLLALRVALAAIFWVHGTGKRKLWQPEVAGQTPSNMVRMMRVLSIVEPLGAVAVFVGFLTQLAAVGLGLVMVGALSYKLRVWKVPFMAENRTGWELDFLIFCAALALVFLGPGIYSLDRVIFGLS